MLHPDTRVKIWWVGTYGNKFTVTTTAEHFKECALEILESKIVDNIDILYYTINNETRELNYYNTTL